MERDKYKILTAINMEQYNTFPKSITAFCVSDFSRTIIRLRMNQNQFQSICLSISISIYLYLSIYLSIHVDNSFLSFVS